MPQLIDNAIALRILYLLTKPFEKTDAYKYGIIDAHGNPLRKLSSLTTPEEKSSYTMLHRLVFRLKKLIALIPGGSSRIATLAAAYFLVKESVEKNEYNLYEDMSYELKFLIENTENLLNEEKLVSKFISEDMDSGAIANSTKNIEEPVYPLGSIVRRKPKRNLLKDIRKLKKVETNVKLDVD